MICYGYPHVKEKCNIIMLTESLIPTTTSIAGGFFIDVLLGYFAKKVIKILMFIAGGIVGLL